MKPIFDWKLLAISLIAGIFIYYRQLDYYRTIPRESLLASALIVIWSYATLKEPYFLLVGLVLLNIFGYKHSF
jgi:hypothetical protein